MRSINFIFFTAVILAVGIGCSNSGGPILLDPSSPEVRDLSFLKDVEARFNPATGEVWVGAPPYASVPKSQVMVYAPGRPSVATRSFADGSFLCKFIGDNNSTLKVRLLKAFYTGPLYFGGGNGPIPPHSDSDSYEIRAVEKDIKVVDPSSQLVLDIAPAGKYPNRLMGDYYLWVVNSGDDQLTPYYHEFFDPLSFVVDLPKSSNPWDASFSGSFKGIITTLFGGVFTFEIGSPITPVVSESPFRPFASPNGCASTSGKYWVANPNPISYFPTQFGQGWISVIDISSRPEQPRVTSEVDAKWLNPQFIITDNNYIYVSCSGTIDFAPPDYHAVALDTGGVQVIDPNTDAVVAGYELGKCGPGPMALSPDSRFLYVGSSVEGSIFRIDLKEKKVLNDASNPIVIDNTPGTYVPFVEVSPEGLLACASFNTDTLRFMDSRTGELDPFPFFGPVKLHPDDPDAFYGPQDAVFGYGDKEYGLVLLTTVKSGFSWLPISTLKIQSPLIPY